MGTVHALLVGINDYGRLGPEADLEGCRNDVDSVEEWLRRSTRGGLRVRRLLDHEAGVTAVEEAVSGFLGSVGPEDSALFWFSGHGCERRAAPDRQRVESTGFSQALVCADGLLWDHRLGALLDGVAARARQTTAVLDCCFAGGGTRLSDGLVARSVTVPEQWLRAARASAAAGPSVPGHVLLAAARLDQLSYEAWFDGRKHGVFTRMLLDSLEELGGEASCRELLAAAQARVRAFGDVQHPVVYPLTAGGPADRRLLGGELRARASLLLRCGPDGWEVDCGTAHGLRGGAGSEQTRFALADGPGELRADHVGTERTLVSAVPGAEPDLRSGLVYPVVLSTVALPPVSVLIGPDAQADRQADAQATAEAVRAALAVAGPGGGPTPLLREVADSREAGRLLLRVELAGGAARVLQRDGSAAVAPVPMNGTGGAERLANCLTHLARWYQVRDLDHAADSLAAGVRVEITPWPGDEECLLPEDGSGEVRLRYRWPGGRALEPRVTIRIRNQTSRQLWCVLVNLTDRHASHTLLFPGAPIGPGESGWGLDGDPVHLRLEPGTPLLRGAVVRDWLKLVVAEGELNTLPFQFLAWDPAAPARRSDPAAGDSVLRLTAPAVHRVLGTDGGRRPGRWGTRTLTLVTEV